MLFLVPGSVSPEAAITRELLDVVLCRQTTFAFPRLEAHDFCASEFASYPVTAVAILVHEHHADLFKGARRRCFSSSVRSISRRSNACT